MQSFKKFIQISDIHIDVHKPVYGRDPRIPFGACLDEVRRDHADAEFIIITGDFTHNGDEESLSYIHQALSSLNIPYFFVLGNHDSRRTLLNIIPDHPKDTNGFIQYSIETSLGTCIVIDSVEEKVSQGSLCEKRLEWLANELANINQQVILFIHHPPCRIGVPAVDKLILAPESSERLRKVISPHKDKIRHMFMGHVHRPICGSWHGIPFSSLPSLSHQVALDLKRTDKIVGITEPAGYGIILVNTEQITIHFKECGEKRLSINF